MFQYEEFLKKLAAYLLWLEDYWQAVNWKEIGKGEKACQNPPEINSHDVYALNWFLLNATAFARDHNLMPELIKELGIEGDEKTLFLYKLNMLYVSFQKIRSKQMERDNAKN